MLRPSALALVLAGLAAGTSPLTAQESNADAAPTEVLILGCFHFSNPGLDVVKTDVMDILSEEKQDEIAAIVDSLALFEPTQIAVERRPGPRAEQMNAAYTRYREGAYELQVAESQQIGFRLAELFELERIAPFDHGGEFPYGEMMSYAKEKEPETAAWVDAQFARVTEESNREQREMTLVEVLRKMNDPEQLAGSHGMYLRFNEIGAGDGFVGADLVAKWYRRNIYMFANLQKLAQPGERIVVIVGAGHAPILRHLVESDPNMRLMDTLAFLPEG